MGLRLRGRVRSAAPCPLLFWLLSGGRNCGRRPAKQSARAGAVYRSSRSGGWWRWGRGRLWPRVREAARAWGRSPAKQRRSSLHRWRLGLRHTAATASSRMCWGAGGRGERPAPSKQRGCRGRLGRVLLRRGPQLREAVEEVVGVRGLARHRRCVVVVGGTLCMCVCVCVCVCVFGERREDMGMSD